MTDVSLLLQCVRPTGIVTSRSFRTLSRLTSLLQELSKIGVGAIFELTKGVTDRTATGETHSDLSEQEKRDNVIALAFGGRANALDAFCREIEDVVPPGTTVVVRGSAVTGRRWNDCAPFDADGAGTSDVQFRGDLLGQPYLTLFEKPEGLSLNGSSTQG